MAKASKVVMSRRSIIVAVGAVASVEVDNFGEQYNCSLRLMTALQVLQVSDAAVRC